MFCEKCGNALPNNARFCAKCGNRVKDSIPDIKPNKKTMNVAKPISEMLGKERIGDFLKDTDLQKVAEGVKKNGNTILGRIQKWIVDYLQTWHECKMLQKREQYIWLGIHGGVILLLISIVVISFTGKSSGNIAAAAKKVVKDGEISEEDIDFLARKVEGYTDVETLWDISVEMLNDGRAEKYGFKESTEKLNEFLHLSDRVTDECIKQSEFASMLEYEKWYDKDGFAEVLYGQKNTNEYIILFQGGLSLNDVGNDENIYIDWYTYENNNKITFVKRTVTFSDDNSNSESVQDIYEGHYQALGAELIITMNEKDYHLTEADTDFAEAEAKSFAKQAGGYWKCTDAFYDMILSDLNVEETKDFADAKFFQVWGSEIILVDENNTLVTYIDWEQGEGMTVTWSLGSASIGISYNRQGNELTLNVNGQDYNLVKAEMIILDNDKAAFGEKGGVMIR